MTSISRTITTAILDWRGLLIRVTFERQRYIAHIQVETLEPIRAPLPITETGYKSSFIANEVIDDAGGPEAFVETWLDDAAQTRGWIEQEAEIRQYALL